MLIEAIKALLRASILCERNGSMIIEQAVQEIGLGGKEQKPDNPLQILDQRRFGKTFQVKGSRSGVTFRSARRGVSAGAPRLQPEMVAEVLHILRPVIYLIAYLKFKRNSWIPWLLSLFVDLARMSLSSEPRNPLEDEELQRRRSDMMYYFLRDPVYNKFTKPFMNAVHQRIFSKIPLINAISDLLVGVCESMNAMHFYKSAS